MVFLKLILHHCPAFNFPYTLKVYTIVRGGHTESRSLFSQIIASRAEKETLIQTGVSQEKIDAASAFEKQSLSRLLIGTQAMAVKSHVLAESLLTRGAQAQLVSRNASLSVVLALLVLELVIVFVVGRQIARSLHILHQGTEIIGGGNLKYRLAITGRDEISQVARSFNQMADNLSRQMKIVQSQLVRLEKSKTGLQKALAATERMNTLMIGRELEMIRLKKLLEKKLPDESRN